MPRAKYATPESRAAFFDALHARLANIPGVTAAAISNGRPVDDHEPRPMDIEGHAVSGLGVPSFSTSPGYFRTIGAPMIAGRDFHDTDRPTAAPIAIVNQRFAATYFPGREPVGQRIRLYEKRASSPGEWRTIVGVVSDIMQNDAMRQRFRPAVYVPFAQQPAPWGWFFARAGRVSEGLADVLRKEASRVDPGLEMTDFQTLETSLRSGGSQAGASFGNLSKLASVAPIFAVIALLLAAVGLYAVVARSVAQRTKEIVVRMALGASSQEIRRLMLIEGMAPVAVGLAVGLMASFAVNHVLQSQLVGVSPYDAVTFTMGPLVLLSVALLGCVFPLRRAVRVDPAVALRNE